MSHITNITQPASPPPLALAYIAVVANVTIGLAGQIGSILVIVIVFSNQSLRTPCFQLIGGGAFGSLMVAAHYFGRGLDQIGGLTGTMLSPRRTVLVCLLTSGIQGIFGIPFHSVVTCLVGIDRTISILSPIKYRSFGKRYVIYLLAGAAAVAISAEIVGFVTASFDTVLTCGTFVEALHPTFHNYVFGPFGIGCNTASVIIYSGMLWSFHSKKRRYKVGTADHSSFMKQQLAALPTVKLLIVLYFFCGIVPDVLINVSVKFDRTRYQWVDYTAALGRFLKVCSSLVEITALMVNSRKFRECARTMVCRKSNGVVVTVSAHN